MPLQLPFTSYWKMIRDRDMNLVLWTWNTRTHPYTKVLVLVLTHFYSACTHAKQSTRTHTQVLCTCPNPVPQGWGQVRAMVLRYRHLEVGQVRGQGFSKVPTVMSLLEALGAKTLLRALLFHAILHVTGALIVRYCRMIV